MVHKQGFIMLGYSQRKDSSAPIHFWTISSAFRQDNLFASLTRASHHDFSPLHVARRKPAKYRGKCAKIVQKMRGRYESENLPIMCRRKGGALPWWTGANRTGFFYQLLFPRAGRAGWAGFHVQNAREWILADFLKILEMICTTILPRKL